MLLSWRRSPCRGHDQRKVDGPGFKHKRGLWSLPGWGRSNSGTKRIPLSYTIRCWPSYNLGQEKSYRVAKFTKLLWMIYQCKFEMGCLPRSSWFSYRQDHTKAYKYINTKKSTFSISIRNWATLFAWCSSSQPRLPNHFALFFVSQTLPTQFSIKCYVAKLNYTTTKRPIK